jgi:hypothetical protein
MYLTGDPEHRDPHLAGRTLIKRAHALVEMGETELAISTLHEAEPMIDPEREPRLLWCLRQNLVDNLTKAGRYEEAQPLLPVLRDLGLAHGSQLDRVRVRWVEARIAAGLGERELGEQGLFEVRQDFLRLTIVFDAALATLELSALYLEDGKTAEVKRLAAEIVEVFEAQAVHREALAALLIFQRAADKEMATASLLREVTEMLERARRL